MLSKEKGECRLMDIKKWNIWLRALEAGIFEETFSY